MSYTSVSPELYVSSCVRTILRDLAFTLKGAAGVLSTALSRLRVVLYESQDAWSFYFGIVCQYFRCHVNACSHSSPPPQHVVCYLCPGMLSLPLSLILAITQILRTPTSLQLNKNSCRRRRSRPHPHIRLSSVVNKTVRSKIVF